MKRLLTLLFFIISIPLTGFSAQVDGGIKKKYSRTSHEFFIAGGYNYCEDNFLDFGLRYVHWTNDGQQIMAFGGPSAGCEFTFGRFDQVFIPYIGWQGQALLIGYGLRAEYAFNYQQGAFGLTPELGISIIELLRITAGYRFSFAKHDPLDISAFRFSILLSIPVSFFD